LVDSGALAWFALPMFQLAGLPVLPILHNVLWPAGFPPRGMKARAKASIDRPFWKQVKGPALGVSEEACRQIRLVRGQKSGSEYRFFPQFRREYFDDIPPPPPRDGQFNVLFVGRAVEEKGLLLLPAIAELVEYRRPGTVRWTICGDGPDLAALRVAVTERSLDGIFDIRGWTTPAEIKVIYEAVHAVIVPTMSSFHEGFAMTAVEAILAGRPLVTNSVVPALEDLGLSSLSALPDNAQSHADAVLRLAGDYELYERLRRSTKKLAEPFYDMKYGLKETLKLAMGN
jgi:glycogen(starch) synthase